MDAPFVRLERIGDGSYGSVYLVNSREEGLFAVKTSLVENSQPLQTEKRILEIFRGYSEIVQCYGGGWTVENGLRLYNLALEYAPGGCLSDLMLKYGGRIPENHVACYTRMILKGLSSIHKLGFVHCDLKPENILVFPTNNRRPPQLKIADFGQAKLPGEVRRFRFRGAPAYMSPESVSDGKIESALDIWSLGCIVLEMITGERPWKEFNDHQFLFKLMWRRDPPTIPDHISETAKDFLMRCFEKNTDRRWTAEMLVVHPFVEKENNRYCFCQVKTVFLDMKNLLGDMIEYIERKLFIPPIA